MSEDAKYSRNAAHEVVARMRARPRQNPPDSANTVPAENGSKNPLNWLKSRRQDRDEQLSLRETNRRLAERLEALEDRSWEIRESEELHRSLAEAFGDVIVDRETDGTIRFANRFARDYFGDLHPYPDVKTNTEAAVSSPKTRDIEIDTLQGKRWFSWADIEMREGVGGERHIRSIGRDITQRKRDEAKLATALKAAQQASTVKSRFLAMVSHEMRTPLNGIAGMARLLTDTDLDIAQRDHVDAIERSGKTLLAMVSDLLDSAQMEAGELQLRPKSVNFRELIEQSAEMLALRAAAKNLPVATFVDPALPENLLLDAERFRQILLNLCTNAVKFTRQGGIAIEATGIVSGENATVTLSVTDSGEGISQQAQRNIFTEFAQVDAGSERHHDGAGLGLFIAQKIAKLMGSQIEVSSREGHGSRFELTFTVPLGETCQHYHHPGDAKLNAVAVVMTPSPARAALLRSVRLLSDRVLAFDTISNWHAAQRRGQCDINVVIVNGQDCFSLTNGDERNENIDPETDKTHRTVRIDHGQTDNRASSAGVDGWLTWPVRFSTLAKVLSEEQAVGAQDRTAAAKPIAALENSPNILLVEDNEINLLVAEKFLNKLGCSVTVAKDGRTAVELFEQAMQSDRLFDHVLLDLNMPGMDGWSVLKALRGLEEKHHSTRIIILSADEREETRTKALNNGADGFLAKPLDFAALAQLIVDTDVA